MNDGDLRELIGRLRNFRERSRAAEQIVALGSDAVAPIVEALREESQEGAKWAMLNCLGEIGSADAVPALAVHLDEGEYQTVAHDALVKIAGRDLGPMPDPWLQWASGAGGALSEEEMDTDRLIELAVEGSSAALKKEAPNRYAVNLFFEGGRQQEVAVIFDAKDHEGSEAVIVYSNCGEAKPESYERALRANLKMPYGAFALRDVGGRPRFVMFNTILRQGLSPHELRKSIFAVGERSLRAEAQLRG